MTFYVCPRCGFKQKSRAAERVRCMRCGRSYQRRAAKTVEKQGVGERAANFVRFVRRPADAGGEA